MNERNELYRCIIKVGIMNKDLFIVSGIVSLVASIICFFIKWQIATGLILGTLFSFVYFFLLNVGFKINDDGSISKGGALLFILRMIMLALPLFIACMIPNVFNIFGAFAGVMIFRIVMMIVYFKKKGEN